MSRAAAHFMTTLHAVLGRFDERKDRGATAVEYGLLVGLIAVAIIAAVTLLGGKLDTLFDNIVGRLPSGAAVPAPSAT
jgi:pilus assembly protein Flp/PilA